MANNCGEKLRDFYQLEQMKSDINGWGNGKEGKERSCN
jgi:hypothetical protein